MLLILAEVDAIGLLVGEVLFGPKRMSSSSETGIRSGMLEIAGTGSGKEMGWMVNSSSSDRTMTSSSLASEVRSTNI